MKEMHKEVNISYKLLELDEESDASEVSSWIYEVRSVFMEKKHEVQYPTYSDLNTNENLSLIQSMQSDTMGIKDANLGMETSTMESLLSLDDGSWRHPPQQPYVDFDSSDLFSENIIRQPSTPLVLAHVQPQQIPFSPTRVVDPRPGPAKSFQHNTPTSNGYQHLHIPLKMMQDFLRLAQENTRKNLETCGVLAGVLESKQILNRLHVDRRNQGPQSLCNS